MGLHTDFHNALQAIDPATVEEPDKPQKQDETLAGFADDDLKRLYGLSLQLMAQGQTLHAREAAHEATHDTGEHNVEECRVLHTELTRLHMMCSQLRRTLWHSILYQFPAIHPMAQVGIRRGWVVVWHNTLTIRLGGIELEVEEDETPEGEFGEYFNNNPPLH